MNGRIRRIDSQRRALAEEIERTRPVPTVPMVNIAALREEEMTHRTLEQEVELLPLPAQLFFTPCVAIANVWRRRFGMR